ncbi:hypothetical protein D9M71_772470 [compost metagenome]
MPALERQRHDQRVDELKIAPDMCRLTADVQPVGVFQHQRQKPGRRLAAQDRPAKAGRQQRRDAPDMIKMDMGDDQRLNAADIEPE